MMPLLRTWTTSHQKGKIRTKGKWKENHNKASWANQKPLAKQDAAGHQTQV